MEVNANRGAGMIHLERKPSAHARGNAAISSLRVLEDILSGALFRLRIACELFGAVRLRLRRLQDWHAWCLLVQQSLGAGHHGLGVEAALQG